MSDEYWGRISEPEKLTPAFFDSHVGERFRVTHRPLETEETHSRPINVVGTAADEVDDAPRFVEVELVEVTRYPKIKDLEGGFDHRGREPFSLLFVGPHELPLMSAVHPVLHEQLGSGQFFFNPVQVTLKHTVDRNPEGRFYEVPFN